MIKIKQTFYFLSHVTLTYKRVGPHNVRPVQVEATQLLLQDPAGLRVGELHQDVCCLVQVSLPRLPLSQTFRCQLKGKKKDKTSDKAANPLFGSCLK